MLTRATYRILRLTFNGKQNISSFQVTGGLKNNDLIITLLNILVILGTRGFVTRSVQEFWSPVEQPKFLILRVCKWK